jgi:4-hydroxyphenylpyruvate dioxygenase
LKGFQKFVRSNPESDKFRSRQFHHIEFYTGEASAVAARFALALGLDLSAASDFSTGNDDHVSLMAQSEDVRLMFTAPSALVPKSSNAGDDTFSSTGLPCFNASNARDFIIKHGLGVRALAVEVDNVTDAYNALLANGGRSALPPLRIYDVSGRGYAEVSEFELYGDAVLRLVNTDNFHGTFLPNFRDILPSGHRTSSGAFGIRRIDHVVGNVWKLAPTAKYVQQMTVGY